MIDKPDADTVDRQLRALGVGALHEASHHPPVVHRELADWGRVGATRGGRLFARSKAGQEGADDSERHPRRRRARRVAAEAIAALGLASIVVIVGMALHQAGKPAAPPGAAATPLAAPVPTLCPPGTPVSDPTGPQQHLLDIQHREACYAAWVANLNVSAVNLNTLQHTWSTVDYSQGPLTSLAAARDAATVIVIGTVHGIVPESQGTNVTITTSQWLKGQAAATLVVRQGSFLQPSTDGQGIIIVDDPAEPLLLPGQSVVLLLQRQSDGSLTPEIYTGIFIVENGRLRFPGTGNVFGIQVNGLAQSDFLAMIAAAR